MVKPWGSFALVSYVPPPLGTFLDNLRRSLPGNDHSNAHITLLPPRDLKVSQQVASEYALNVLQSFSQFDVNLASVKVFPVTNVVYLDLAEGNATVHEIHDHLDQGDLKDHELFEFLPHVTLGGPIDEDELRASFKAASDAWDGAAVPKEFQLGEVVALWAEPGAAAAGVWERIWSHSLKPAASERSASAAIGRTS